MHFNEDREKEKVDTTVSRLTTTWFGDRPSILAY